MGFALVAVSCSDRQATPELIIDRQDFDFGDIRVGEKGESRFVLRNAGLDVAGPVSVRLSGAPSFSIAASTCAGMLQPGETCEVLVEFLPGHRGQSSATLAVEERDVAVTSDLRGTGVVQVTIRTTGTALGRIVSEPAGLDCGDACAGFFSDESISLRVVEGGLRLRGWGDECVGTFLCRLPLQDEDVQVDAIFAAGYDTSMPTGVVALEIDAGGTVFAVGPDRVFKLDDAGEILATTIVNFADPDLTAGMLDDASFFAAGRTNDLNGSNRAMYAKFHLDLQLSSASAVGLIEPNSESRVLAPHEDRPMIGGVRFDETSPVVFVSADSLVYLDETGLDDIHAMQRLSGGGVVLGVAAGNQRFVYQLSSSLNLTSMSEMTWDAVTFSPDVAVLRAESENGQLLVAKAGLDGEDVWTTALELATADSSMFIDSGRNGEEVVVAALDDNAARAWVVRLDGDNGEVFWIDSVPDITTLGGVVVTEWGIVLWGGSGSSDRILGFVATQ